MPPNPRSISNPYLLGWGSPRLCTGLGIIVLRVGARATGGPEAGGKGNGGSCPGALTVHSRFHGDHVGVDVVIGKVIQVGRAAGRERVSASHTEEGVEAGPHFRELREQQKPHDHG